MAFYGMPHFYLGYILFFAAHRGCPPTMLAKSSMNHTSAMHVHNENDCSELCS
jgi:hypothetical protein